MQQILLPLFLQLVLWLLPRFLLQLVLLQFLSAASAAISFAASTGGLDATPYAPEGVGRRCGLVWAE